MSEPRPASLFRLVHSDPPTPDDFRSRMTLCMPPRPFEQEHPGEWAGLSVYGTWERAAATARRFPDRRLGNFVAELRLPDGAPAVVRQTFRPGHHTIWCCAEWCLSSVVDTRPVDR